MYTQKRGLTIVALGLALVAPASAFAQHSMEPIKITERQVQADRLDREAEGYEQSDLSQLRKAASLRKESASLRSDEDPQAAVSLSWAGRDSYYGGDIKAGRDLLVQSAERAMTVGDVMVAATAYTEAAYVAAELRDVQSARYYVDRARLLSSSPMLSDTQRAQIRARLAVATASPVFLAAR